MYSIKKVFPVWLHALLDYVSGLLLVLSPLYIPYTGAAGKTVGLACGAALLTYSIMTDYPPAILRFIPFPVHRTFDFLVGFALLFSPIHFLIHGAPAYLFCATGFILIVIAFLTRGSFSKTGQDQPIFPGA